RWRIYSRFSASDMLRYGFDGGVLSFCGVPSGIGRLASSTDEFDPVTVGPASGVFVPEGRGSGSASGSSKSSSGTADAVVGGTKTLNPITTAETLTISKAMAMSATGRSVIGFALMPAAVTGRTGAGAAETAGAADVAATESTIRTWSTVSLPSLIASPLESG